MLTKTLKFSDYIKITRPTYNYVKITSHKSIKSYDSTNIAKMIALTFKALNKRMYKLNKQWIVETNFKISYVIDIKKDNAEFYFIVPSLYLNQLLEKINEIWNKATVEVVNKIDEPLMDFVYEVRTKKEDSLSIAYDKKTNEPLNNILASMDIMQDEDRVSLLFNFIPSTQFGWGDRYKSTMDKIKKGEPLEKPTMTPGYMLKKSVFGFLSMLEVVFNVMADFAGADRRDEKESLYNAILGVMEQQKDLSTNTKKKRDSLILPTEIAICSNKEELCLSTSQSFRVLDEDNEIVSSRVKKPNFSMEDYSFGLKESVFSVDEISNFIKIPDKKLLNQFGIKHVNVEETQVDRNLLKGTKKMGIATYRGKRMETFLDTQWDSANTCLTIAGGQGSGKSTFISNYARDCINANEGVILIDFIKNCELSNDIEKLVPEDKLVVIDLAKEENIQAFSYNEVKITDDMTTFEMMDKATMQSDLFIALIDSVNAGCVLNSSMRRVFNASCVIASVGGHGSLKDIVRVMEDYRFREAVIDKVKNLFKQKGSSLDSIEEELGTLNELNKYDEQGNVIGTESGDVNFILDRVDLLRSNYKLKCMYKADASRNIDLKKAMDENKVILIKMREVDFPTNMQKNILVTYWTTKIWLATKIRGAEQRYPNRVNFIIDEIFQSPTSLGLLKNMLVEARKFALKMVLSIHYVNQVGNIFESLLTSNGSFMLMKGCTEEDFNYLKNKIEGLEYEDLKNMKRYHSLNVVCHGEGYCSYIGDLTIKTSNVDTF